MFVNERPQCLRMAFGADGILIRIGSQQLVLQRAMRIVAIATDQNTFVDLVMKRLRERRLHIGMAGVAELGLRHLEQVQLTLRTVGAMTSRTADPGQGVRGTIEVCMRSEMAGKTLCIHDLGSGGEKVEDLCLIAAGLDVRLAGAVTAFAGNTFTGLSP